METARASQSREAASCDRLPTKHKNQAAKPFSRVGEEILQP